MLMASTALACSGGGAPVSVGADGGDAAAADAGLPADDGAGLDLAPPEDLGPPDPFADELPWEPCSLFTGSSSPGALCLTWPLPLRHDDPEGPTIDVFVKRIPGGGRGQLWLLQGGPGGVSAYMEGNGRTWGRAVGYDAYIVEHRGVGRSTRLGCAEQEAQESDEGYRITPEEFGPCVDAAFAQFGEDEFEALSSVTEAARDLGALMELFREPNDPLFLYGVSYGTYWGSRFLQLFPELVDGAILDSICGPGGCGFPLRFDVGFDEIGREVLAACADDEACAALFETEDPYAEGFEALRSFDTRCPIAAGGRTTAMDIRGGLGFLLTARNTRRAVPAVLRMAARCDVEDQRALRFFGDLLFPESPTVWPDEVARLRSDLLFHGVVRSELQDDPVLTPEAYAESLEELVFRGGGRRDVELYRATLEALPRIAPDPATFGRVPETSRPVLMLNGALDPQTPPSVGRSLYEVFTGPNKYYVEMPRATHVVANTNCGRNLVLAFLRDPTAEPNLGCLDDLDALDFSDNTDLARAYFGLETLYPEGDAPEAARSAVVDVEAIEALRERAREWARSGPAFRAGLAGPP
ncbi:MAG: alpha/beta fold hydrolase [Myxococcota bacterium]